MEFLRKLFRRERPPIESSIPYLLDKSGDLGIRDDIAMDLNMSDAPETEAALLRIAQDHGEEEILIDSAGDSLAQIWARKGFRDESAIDRMHPSARIHFRTDGT